MSEKIPIGRVSLVPQKNWQGPNAEYKRLDMVLNQGALYIAKKDIPKNSNINITNNSYWMQATGKWNPNVQININNELQEPSGEILNYENTGNNSEYVLHLNTPGYVFGTEIIDDNAGNEDTTHVWSADKTFNEFSKLQTATEYVNLFYFNNKETRENKGVSIVVNDDCTVTLNGTAEESSNFHIMGGSFNTPNVFANKTYIFNCELISGETSRNLDFYTWNGTGIPATIYSLNTPYTFEEDTPITLHIYSGSVFTNAKFRLTVCEGTKLYPYIEHKKTAIDYIARNIIEKTDNEITKIKNILLEEVQTRWERANININTLQSESNNYYIKTKGAIKINNYTEIIVDNENTNNNKPIIQLSIVYFDYDEEQNTFIYKKNTNFEDILSTLLIDTNYDYFYIIGKYKDNQSIGSNGAERIKIYNFPNILINNIDISDEINLKFTQGMILSGAAYSTYVISMLNNNKNRLITINPYSFSNANLLKIETQPEYSVNITECDKKTGKYLKDTGFKSIYNEKILNPNCCYLFSLKRIDDSDIYEEEIENFTFTLESINDEEEEDKEEKNNSLETNPHAGYYNDMQDEAFSADVLDCAISYIVHQINNNSTITGTPNDNKPMFYSKYAGHSSWRTLLSKHLACSFGAKDYEIYNNIEYPVYYSHCTPFHTSIMSCVNYKDSAWCYLFEHPDYYALEKKYNLTLEDGIEEIVEGKHKNHDGDHSIIKPYTYNCPNAYISGPENAFINSKVGAGLIILAEKENDHWNWNDDIIKTLKTGDWIHISRSNNDHFVGHAHTMMYIKTLDEIKEAVRKYGCELVSWYGKEITDYNPGDEIGDGSRGFVIESTSHKSNNGHGTIQISDLVYTISKARNSNNILLSATRSMSSVQNSYKAFRFANSFGELFFLHQPYSGCCINGEPLFLSILPSKESCYCQWQSKTDNNDWIDIPGENLYTYTKGNPIDGTQYRCKVQDKMTGRIIYSDPITCYKINISNPIISLSNGTYEAYVNISGDSASRLNNEEGYWEYKTKLDNNYNKTKISNGTSITVTIEYEDAGEIKNRIGYRYRFRQLLPDGTYYTTKSFKIVG